MRSRDVDSTDRMVSAMNRLKSTWVITHSWNNKREQVVSIARHFVQTAAAPTFVFEGETRKIERKNTEYRPAPVAEDPDVVVGIMKPLRDTFEVVDPRETEAKVLRARPRIHKEGQSQVDMW
jgi:hypothetical protein